MLKQRIAGRQGHLSNRHSAEMIAEIASDSLKLVYLCHLSLECNSPELALKEVQKALAKRAFRNIQVKLTFPAEISEIWSDE